MPRPVRPIPPLATRKKGRKKAGAALLTAAIAMAPPSPAEATMEEVFTPGFEDYLKDVEGYGAGYDKKTKKYYPYSDVKGHLTIGVGHKILDDELQALSKGLTDEEVNSDAKGCGNSHGPCPYLCGLSFWAGSLEAA